MTPEQRAFDTWIDRAFLNYHREWILDRSQIAIAVKSRQIAMTSATAGGAVFWGLGGRRRQVVISASQTHSNEVIAKARAHCEILAACGHRGALDFTVDNTTEIAWRTGGRIKALASNPRTARAESGDVWLDEFANHADPEGIRDAAFAMVSTGDLRLRIFSTPQGAQGLFYDWITTPPPGWRLHRITVDDAIAQGFPADLEKLRSLAGGDDRVFNQWYRCSFLDADLQYISTALADGAMKWIGKVPDMAGATYYAGFDIGRRNDLSVLTVIALVGRVAWVVAVVPMKRTAFREQKRTLYEFRAAFQWQSFHVDESGMGIQFAEELVESWGDEEVKPIAFTSTTKADLATRTLRWLRDSRVRLPKDAEGKALYRDIIAVRRKIATGGNGNVSYESPTNSSGHGDRFWSLALALKGCGEPPVLRGMESSSGVRLVG